MASIDISQLRQEILERFGSTLEENLIAECIRVCQMFNLRGEDLFFKWESMWYGTGQTWHPITLDELPALKARCQSDLAKASAARQKLKVDLNGSLSRNFTGGAGRAGSRFGTTAASRTPVKPSVRRQDGFSIIAGEDKRMPVAGPSKVKFVGPKVDEESRKRRAYRYMYETAADRSRALDTRIDDFGELVKEHYNIEELGDPAAGTEEDVVVVGRITHDSETSSGPVKLNEASLTLESSRQMGSGARVPIRFDPNVKIREGKQGAGGVGLFPGAIVALKGKNGGGGWFLVTEILSLPPLGPSPQIEIKQETSEPFRMYVACGPFTVDADLKFSAWYKLLSKIKTDKPAAVLLVGPFIDAAHPAIKDGEVDMTPADMFREHFLANMQSFLASSPGSIFLIVPSVRDVISDHAVFPQCEFGDEFSSDPRIHLLPNPCRFSLNGISFGVSSVDVIFHLRKEEFFKRAQDSDPTSMEGDDATVSDAMTNTCRHLLQQRSFYPLFPVPLDLSHEINLDVTHSDGLDLGGEGTENNYAPDVLITPSRLKQFSKVVDSTIALNPSFLTKGTYATLTCGGPGAQPVQNRVQADVLRLD